MEALQYADKLAVLVTALLGGLGTVLGVLIGTRKKAEGSSDPGERATAREAPTIGLEGLRQVADAYRQTSLGAADPQMIAAVKRLAHSVEGLARAQLERAERDPKRMKQFEDIIDEIRQVRRSIEDLAGALERGH